MQQCLTCNAWLPSSKENFWPSWQARGIKQCKHCASGRQVKTQTCKRRKSKWDVLPKYVKGAGKICPTCNEHWPEAGYAKGTKERDGLHWECKCCARTRDRRNYQNRKTRRELGR